jgi:hypothetical protein
VAYALVVAVHLLDDLGAPDKLATVEDLPRDLSRAPEPFA